MTVDQAMQAAHLGGWNVRKVTVHASEPSDEGVDVIDCAGNYMVVRTNPFTGAPEGLGVVGESWTPIQNEEHALFLQTLVDEGGATLDTAGSLCGGRRVFLTMALPDGIRVGGVDQVDMNIACLNSHDGTAAFQTVVTPVRVVCANTERAALARNTGSYKVRQTASATGQIAEARRALELTFAYTAAWAAEVERMAAEPLTTGGFRVIAKTLIRPGTETTSTRQDRADAALLDHLTGLFSSPLNRDIAGTRWAGFNAFTDHYDHHARVAARGENPATVRARRALLGGADHLKTAAFTAFHPATL